MDSPRARAFRANDQLNVAFIGVGGMGGGNLGGISACPGVKVVALCDIDGETLKGAAARHKEAKTFFDYREMLSKLEKEIDAVVVSTPDHTHAPAAVMAMRMGKHCYCEKPLTYTVTEARMMRALAAEKKLMTQMGNRGTATGGFRAGVETIRSGALGKVKEVHVWTNRPIWPQGAEAIMNVPVVREAALAALRGKPAPALKMPEAPKHIHWDLFLGCAPERPYTPGIHPFSWRGWIDFGTGALGDMACHTANLAYMGLQLGSPTSVKAEVGTLNPETYPMWSVITFEFPARGEMPPVKVVWYDGLKGAKKNMPGGDVLKGIDKPVDSGSLLIGDQAVLYTPNDYGDQQVFLTPARGKMEVKRPEPTLPRIKKPDTVKADPHYFEWVQACMSGTPALSNFDYAARLTEFVLLGNVAMLAGKKVEYDGEQGKITNPEEANKLLVREYRKGFGV
jgi:predicted dehydrogenase